jgi:phosphate transport system substrate-binding protein
MTNRLPGPSKTEEGSVHAPALRRAMACVMLFAILAVAGCSGEREADSELVVTGSTTILPIAEIAGEMYHEIHLDRKILVSGLGSSAGIENVATGTSDIGTSSRDLKAAEEALNLYDTPIAYDAIAVIVNPSNPVDELTTEQVRAIFAGEIENWSELGGEDRDIGLVNRDEASGTREAFHKIVMGDVPFDRTAAVLPGTGQVRSVVENARGAIGYISLGFVNEDVKVVRVDGVVPTAETVVSGEYPLQRLLHFFTVGPPEGLAADYIEFVLSNQVQQTVVRDAGFTPISGEVE